MAPVNRSDAAITAAPLSVPGTIRSMGRGPVKLMRMITEILDEEDDLTITEITARVQDRIGYGQSFDTLRRSVFRAVMKLHDRDLVLACSEELPTNDLGGYTYGYRVARLTYQREGRP